MKYTREFWFLPSFDNKSLVDASWNDINPIPPFNSIASTLNDAGWEIIEFHYETIFDIPSSYNARLSRNLLIYATTTNKPKTDNPKAFIYRMSKNGLVNEYNNSNFLDLVDEDLCYRLAPPTFNEKGRIDNEELD